MGYSGGVTITGSYALGGAITREGIYSAYFGRVLGNGDAILTRTFANKDMTLPSYIEGEHGEDVDLVDITGSATHFQDNGWDFADTWQVIPGGLPQLQWQQ